MKTLSERSGWVLAGGRSTRMGNDKALTEIEGKPLVLIVADRIAAAVETVSIVGDPAKYGQLGLAVLPDNFPGQGPLSGIEAALAASATDWNLIVACDMPALDVSILEALFALKADCALPRYEDGRVEPLCAVYHRRCHSEILAALNGGIRKVTDALPPETLRYLQVASAASFANLNTPEELRKYRNG